MADTIRATREVTASVHEYGMVFFDTKIGRLFAANQAGAQIWGALQEGRSPEAIAAQFAGRYRIAPDTARTDIDAFLAALERHDLTEVRR
jgi:hypothetical protein